MQTLARPTFLRLVALLSLAAALPTAAVAQGLAGPHAWSASTGLEPEQVVPGWVPRFFRSVLPGPTPCTHPTRSLGPAGLRIDTLGCAQNVGYFEQASFRQFGIPQQTLSFEAVLRVVQTFPGSDATGFTVNVNGGCEWVVSVGDDDVSLSYTSLPEQRVSIGSNAAFRTYRLEIQPGGILADLYVDGQHVLSGVGTTAPGGVSCGLVLYSALRFGDFSAQQNGIAEWRSFVHDTVVRGYEFCDAEPSSAGTSTRLYFLGSTSVAQNSISIGVDTPQVPAPIGVMLASRTAGTGTLPASSSGRLCLTGAIGRFLGPGQLFPFSTSLGGLILDLNVMPQPNGPVAVQPGESWSFQLWYRDANPQPTSNFSTALTVLFE